jgi:hypothetical protein
MGLFSKEKSLEELEQENQKLEVEHEIAKKQYNIAMLKKRLDAKGGKGFWSKFTGNSGKGFSVGKAVAWLKNH